MSISGEFGNPLRKFKLVFLGEQSDMGGSNSKNTNPPSSASSSPVHRQSTTSFTISPATSSYTSAVFQAVPTKSTLAASHRPPPAPLPRPTVVSPPKQNVTVANPLPQHDANNYIIPKINSENRVEPRAFILLRGTKVDRFFMKVCPKYPSRKGCNAQYCYRFHVCPYWIKDKCWKKECTFDHDLMAEHNSALLEYLLTRKFSEADMREKLKKYMYGDRSMREDVADCICMDNILKKCAKPNCMAMHFDSQYVWEIYLEGQWTQFPKTVSDETEELFRNPQNGRVEISRKLNRPPYQNNNAIRQVFGGQNIKVDFESMSLTSDKKFFRIKRLSTPSDTASFSSVATRWLWFWENDQGNWHFYTNALVGDYYIIPFSDYIEAQFLKKVKEFSFKIPSNSQFEYSINLESMIQTNKTTLAKRKIKRRPMGFLEDPKWKDNTTFRSLWSNTNSTRKYQRRLVPPNSCEFNFVRQMIAETLSVSGIEVERVENHHLWQAYQLKKSQMLNAFTGNTKSLNEQYLFHGTCESVLDKICSENLDWRLYGTNVGNVFGRGTYFAKEAKLSNSYAQKNEEGLKYMFVVYVLVGTAAVGNSSMTLPPVNPAGNLKFDTTVNSCENPTVFVKYNLDEYYPAYLVKFRA